MINRLSNNAGGVKHFLGALLPALGRERHFALAEALPIQPKARSQSVFRSGTRSDPCISSVHNFDHDYYFELLREGGAGCPINFSVFYCTPWRFPGCPACELNFLTCS